MIKVGSGYYSHAYGEHENSQRVSSFRYSFEKGTSLGVQRPEHLVWHDIFFIFLQNRCEK